MADPYSSGTPASSTDPAASQDYGGAFNPGPNYNPQKYRQEQAKLGVKGKQLDALVKAYKQQQATNLTGSLNPDVRPFVKDPAAFYKNLVHGKGPAFRKLALLQQAGNALGYKDAQNQLAQDYSKGMAGIAGENVAGEGTQIERNYNETPTFTAFQQYVAQHINPQTGEATGLTADEQNAIRNPALNSIYGTENAGMQSASSRLAAAGMDPRSGVGTEQAMALQHQTAQSKADLENQITQENLQRKQQFEGYAGNMAAAEEGRRQYDTSGDLARLAQIETGTAGLANLNETQRQYDVGYTESQRQAKLARDAAAKAARQLQPSTLEKVSSGISGLFQGLGGGGGGGMGGMGGGGGGGGGGGY